MAILILPVNIDFDTWANQLWIDLPGRDIPKAEDSTEWREFACELYVNPNLSNVPYPHKEYYLGKDGWRDWAEEFINNIYL